MANERVAANPNRRPENRVEKFEDIEGSERIDQDSMLALLAQNVELSGYGKAPPSTQEAIKRGLQSRDIDHQENPGRPTAAPPPPPPRPESRPMSAETLAMLPPHIRAQMEKVDAARAAARSAPETGFAPTPEGFQEIEDERRAFTSVNEQRSATDRPTFTPEQPEQQAPAAPKKLPPITNVKNAPARQPEISDEERAQFRTAPDTAEASTPTRPRFIRRPVNRDPKTGFTRIDLVSGYVFYDFKDLRIRKFNIDDGLLIEAAKRENSVSHLIDAVGRSLEPGVDVRDLTYGDFRQLLYWHKFNSYSGYFQDFEWTSRYGNRQTHRLVETDISYITLKIEEQDLQPWLDEGYTAPRVRDFELFQREPMNQDDAFLASRAQYFVGYTPDDGGPPDIQDKIDMLNDKCAESLDAMLKISQFIELIDHGVRESVLLRDEKFDPKEYVVRLERERAEIEKEISARSELIDDSVREMIFMLSLQRDELAQEIDKFSEEGAAAEIEEHPLDVPLLNFFPNL